MNKITLKKASLSLTAVILIGIFAVVNFFSYQIFYRFDLTESKDYSISKVSKNTASNLDDIVTIKAYFSENLPSQYITLRQEVGDILDEYANYSKGKIKVEFIDPKDNPELAKEINSLGIPQLQFNILEKDKYQVVNGYLGMAIQYADKHEVIPVIQDTTNFEYQVTLALKKVTGQVKAVVGFVSSNSTLSTENEIKEAYTKVSELYDVRAVDLKTNKEVPPEINTLIIAGPKSEFSDDELKKIDAFFMKGGSLLIMADGITIGKGLEAKANNTRLDKILSSYGLKLNNDLVADVSSGMASFTQGFMTFSTNYPFWPKVLNAGFDKNNAAVAKLESVIFPWVSSVDKTDKMDQNNKISYLVKTTNKAWKEEKDFNLNPQMGITPNGSNQYTLAISASGKFSSAIGKNATNNSRIILVGDSDFLNDGFLKNAPDNLTFFQNLVDSLSLDEDLISIRSKGVSERPIKELSEGAKAAIRYGNIFGMTIIIIAFGMIRYYLRRKVKFADEI